MFMESQADLMSEKLEDSYDLLDEELNGEPLDQPIQRDIEWKQVSRFVFICKVNADVDLAMDLLGDFALV